MRRRTVLLLALVLVGLGSGPGVAQEAPPWPFWTAATYEQSRFRQDLEPWHLASVEAGARGAGGAVLLRGSLAQRFGERGEQVEVEAYPRLAGSVYALVLAGVSGGGLFPRWQAGGELFGSPAQGVEVSAGARHLAFEPDAVTILTGSVGLYRGPFYVVARPFAGRQAGTTSLSGFVLARRFLDDERWVGLRVGGGAVPTDAFTEAEFQRLGAVHVAAQGRTPVADRLVLGVDVGWEREELPADRERSRFTIGTRLEYRFR